MNRRWQKFVYPSHADWTWRMLEAFYSAPGRHYHTLVHIACCLDLLDQVATIDSDDQAAAELAIWFHDLIYVPGDPDNETMSAKILDGISLTLRMPEILIERAKYCILATRHKETKHYDPLHALVVDIDLSILGSEPVRYEEYVIAVRKEFSRVSEEAWRVGRANFLATMLAREKIFAVLGQFETQARENMAHEFNRLTSPDKG